MQPWSEVHPNKDEKFAVEFEAWVLKQSSYSRGGKAKSGLLEGMSNKVVTQGNALSLLCETPSVII